MQLLGDTVFYTGDFAEAKLAGAVRLWVNSAAAGAARCFCVLVCGLHSAVWGLEGEHKGLSADDCVERC